MDFIIDSIIIPSERLTFRRYYTIYECSKCSYSYNGIQNREVLEALFTNTITILSNMDKIIQVYYIIHGHIKVYSKFCKQKGFNIVIDSEYVAVLIHLFLKYLC